MKLSVFPTAYILAVLVLCRGVAASARQGSTGTVADDGGLLSVTLVKTVPVTTDAEGGSARPEIIATSNRVFVVYLGNITSINRRTFNMRVFDASLASVIATRTLVETTADYGGPTDIRIASDSRYVYAFYETHRPTFPIGAKTYLWGAKYTLDDRFERVAHTAGPIASSQPMGELQDGGELVDDPAPLIGPTSVFVVTRLKHSLSTAGKTTYRVREFSKDDLTKLSEFDLDLSGVVDGRARVSSLLVLGKSILIVLPTTVSDSAVNENSDDGARSDVVVVRMGPDWSFDPSQDVHTLSAEPDDRENYVSGFETDGRYLYVTYKQSVGVPGSGEHRAWIKVFERDFEPVYQERVKSAGWGPGGGEIRPSLELSGRRMFSGQSGGRGIGQGNGEVYVYELTFERARGASGGEGGI